jgi:small subunit ribosomal protein S5
MSAYQVHAQSEFEERVVQIDRVARVMKGGRRFRFRATVVVGDRKGRVGLGVGKGTDVQTAIQKAIAVAKKSQITVKIHRDSVPFEVTARFAGAKLLMKPARPGTGIIAGGAVRPVIELSGIANILSKSLGSDNRINNAKAAIAGLQLMAATDISRIAGPAIKKDAPKAAVDAEEASADEVAKAETKETESSDRQRKNKTGSGTTKKKTS